MAETSWLDFRSTEYRSESAKWAYTRDHYTGAVVSPGLVESYLVQRKVGEPREAFSERAKLADYTPHFSAVVDALAGMLFQVEAGAKRHFRDPETKKGLGDPMDRNTVIGRLWEDADGEGTGWVTLWRQAAIELTLTRLVWVVVDPTADGEPRVRVLPAPSVVNYRLEDGRPVEVLVEETADVRRSIREDPTEVTQWVLYTTEGWERWGKDAEGQEVPLGSGDYSYEDRAGRPALPIFPVRLPMRRDVGYMLARKANAIFNKESERDFLLRVSNFPLLNLVGGDELVKNLKEALAKGERVLQVDPTYPGSHAFIAPDSGPATAASDVLERKVEEFYKSAFREYADAAIERTATEVRQDVASGVGAFLTMLKAAVDEAENGAIWRLEQQQSSDKGSWFVGWVERPDQFLPMDIEAQVTALRDRYFGQGQAAPVGEEAQVAALKKILEWDGIPYREEELLAGVRVANLKDLLQVTQALPIPPLAKSELVVRLLAGLGVVDPETAVTLADGTEALLGDVLKREALALAEAEAETKRRQAEAFGPF